MDKAAEAEFTAEVAREMLTELAPHELEIFPLVSEAYFRDPAGALRSQPQRDDILGSGLEPGAVFLTPVVLLVLGEVVRFLAEESTAVIRASLRRLFRWWRPEASARAADPPLPADTVRRVHDLALDRARLLLPDDEAQMLAEQIAGALAIGEARGDA
jgi:hypothetical protein